MSAAAKIRVAKQPRTAGGRFGATTNAQEQLVVDLNSKVADLHNEVRLLTRGNLELVVKRDQALADVEQYKIHANSLTADRDTWKGRAESQLDTIQGDRKQIAKLQTALGQVSELLHFRAPSPNESIDDWGSDLRDAYEEAMRQDAETLYAPVVAERDRLKGELGLAREQRDAINARLNASRTTLALATFLVCVLFLSNLVFGVALLMPGSTGGVK
jgi:chromosome segregation ATPase